MCPRTVRIQNDENGELTDLKVETGWKPMCAEMDAKCEFVIQAGRHDFRWPAGAQV